MGGAPRAEARPDCLSCRVTGTIVCLALSASTAVQHYARPAASPITRALTLAAAGGFAALGVARALV
jgi:hypothetical protein